MATTPSVDYTSRTQEEIFLSLRSLIPQFLPEWTYQGEDDFGIGLLRLFSHMADVLHFYSDRALNEAMLPTALSRDNVINICKLIDYELRGRTAGIAVVRFSVDAALGFPVTIPAGTVVQATASDGQPVLYETDEEGTLATGTTSVEIAVTEGESFIGQSLATSDGSISQRYQTPLENVVPTSLKVFVDEGGGPEQWTEVDSFFLSVATDKVYYTQRDGLERVTVFFGDGVRGKIPTATSPITFDARVGGGTRGNVAPGAISTLTSSVFGGSPPVSIPLRVTNLEAASGGDDPESIEEAREAAPKSLRSMNRAVTAEDYEFFADQVDGVFAARARIAGDPITRRVNIVVVPTGGGIPPAALKQAVEDALETRRMLGTVVEAANPNYVALDIQGTVKVLPNFRRLVVRSAVLAAMADFFDLTNPDASGFGTALRISNVFGVIEEIPGVDFVNFQRFTVKPIVNKIVFTPSSAEFVSVNISPTTISETWTIRITSPTTFIVEGSESGIQSETGVVGEPYVTQNKELSFILSYPISAPNLMSPGDFATIRVSGLIGDVIAIDDEFLFEPLEGQQSFTFEGGA